MFMRIRPEVWGYELPTDSVVGLAKLLFSFLSRD